jgi:hypothetical protein
MFNDLCFLFLYGFETRSVTLREEHRPRVLENRMLRKIFGRKREEVIEEWRGLRDEKLYDLYAILHGAESFFKI